MLKILQNEGIIGAFKLYRVDDMNENDIIRTGLKTVPTIIIYQQNGQSQVFEGKFAFDWVRALIENRRRNYSNMVEMNRRSLLKHNAELNKTTHGPLGFIKSELVGMSDDYAYLHGDVAQPKQYMMNNSEDSIITLKSTDSKISNKEQKDLINKYQQNRETQNTQIEKMFEQQIINKVLENEINGQQLG